MKKIIKFIKNDFWLFLSILSLFFCFVFLITGLSLSYPFLNLEQEYQVANFGFYDSTKVYLLDVRSTLNNYSIFIYFGIAFDIMAFISIIFNVFDFSLLGRKHEKENN